MICRLTFPALLFLAVLPSAFADTVISVANYGAVADSGQDATLSFQQAIAAAAAAPKPAVIEIPAGRYDLFPAQAVKRACYFSNATENGSNAIRTIGLDLSNLDRVTLRGPGAKLVMRGAMTMVVAEGATDLSLSGLTFDFQRPPVSEITALEKGAGFWIGQVHPDSTYTITGGNRIQWKGEDWENYHNLCQPFDPVRQITWRGTDPTGSATAVEDLGQGKLKFTVPSGSLAAAVVGYSYQFRNGTRDQAGMWFSRCRNVSMTDVNVHAMRGFGILSQFTENVTFTRLNVGPEAGRGRTAACAADILHFSGCKGTIRVSDSKLTAAHDDAMNVHGTHLRIMATPAADQIRVRFMHAQTWGFQAFVPGDVVEFVKPGTLLSYGSATVTGVQMLADKREQLLTLNGPAPAGITLNSDVVENVTWTPTVEVTNCDIAQIPTRGFLLTSRRPITIQGCRFFRTQMPSILTEDDAAGWYESGPVRDLTLRGNSFYESGGSTIDFSPQNSTHQGAVHSNIKIVGNDFTLTGGNAMHFKSTDGITISGTRFRMRNGSTPTVASLVSSSNTANVTYADNGVEPAATAAIAPNNGGFQLPAVGPLDEVGGMPTGWFGPAGGVVKQSGSGVVRSEAGYVASQSLVLLANGYVYQRIGPIDPVQGASLRWSLRQLTGDVGPESSGPIKVDFFSWDGVFVAAPGADPAGSGMTKLGSFTVPALPASKVTRVYRGNLDLAGLPAGNALWVRLAAADARKARIDDFSAAASSSPELSDYATWAADNGLAGVNLDPLADPDHDGMSNLLEYTFDGCDPLVPDFRPLMTGEITGGWMNIRFRPRALADVQVIPEYQFADLATGGWQVVEDGKDGLEYVLQAGESIVSVDTPAAAKAFFRLRARILPAAGPVLTNGSFESPDQTGVSPAYSNGSPTGWTFTSGVNGGVEEIRDSRFGTAGPEGSRLSSLGAAGDQLAYINIGNSGTGSALSEAAGNVAPNTIYTVKVTFGQRATGDRHPSGGFGLQIDGVNVGVFTPIGTLTTGFNERTYTWVSPPFGDPLIGKPMRVRMNFTYDTAAGGWQQAQFDNVRLTATAP